LPEDEIETGRYFHPLLAIAVEPSVGTTPPLILTGGAKGLFRRRGEQGEEHDSYVKAAPQEVEQVLVPRDWLICSGAHAVLEANASEPD
jgi:hypothetical protein